MLGRRTCLAFYALTRKGEMAAPCGGTGARADRREAKVRVRRRELQDAVPPHWRLGNARNPSGVSWRKSDFADE